MKIPVVENVLKLNDEIAALNRARFAESGVYALDLIGAPGCGKTALLDATLRHFQDRLRIGVLVGDLTTSRDGERLGRCTRFVVQINTGRGCHLDANQVRQGLQQLPLDELDAVLIENVGNLICPVGFDLGQHDKVGMFSLSEGDDKAAKHPYLVRESSLLLLNKLDLAPHVDFDLTGFRRDVRQLNPSVPLAEISVARGDLAAWFDWLGQRVRRSVAPGETFDAVDATSPAARPRS